MVPAKRRGGKTIACRQWRLEDLVLTKVKGFPAWTAKIRQSIFHPHLFALRCMLLLLFALATTNYILLVPIFNT